MRYRGSLALLAIVANGALPATSVAQLDDPQLVRNYIMVRLRPDVEPAPLADGWLSFRYVTPSGLPPGLVLATEVLIADAIGQWAVTSVYPVLNFPLQSIEDIARQVGLDRVYVVTVPNGTDTPAMVQHFAAFTTHVEDVSVGWYGEFLGPPPDDTFFLSDQ